MSRIILPTIPDVRFDRLVGEGGTSTVWRGYDSAHDRTVAIKLLRRECCQSEADIEQFRAEAAVMGELEHPGIVRAYDFDHVGDDWYFLMEYVDGYSFSELLRRKQHLGEADCLMIGESVASALALAWNEHGIVHCDLKPENLMINSAGVIKLTDLGIFYRAHSRELAEGEASELVSGTPAYISPEQVYGDTELDQRSDIYSLGATLYQLATGRLLFPALGDTAAMKSQCDPTAQAPDPRLYRRQLSLGFAQLLEAMLVKDRNERLQGWSEVYELCQAVEAGNSFEPRDSTSPSSIRLEGLG